MMIVALARGAGSKLRRSQRLLAALLELRASTEYVTASTALPALGVAAPAQLWKYDSPLLRHLSTQAASASSAQQLKHESEALDALPEYGLLKQRAHVAETVPEQQLELLPGELEHVKQLLRHFQHSAAVKDQALGLYVNAKLFRIAILAFQEFLLSGMVPELRDALGALRPGPASADALFPYFAQFVLDNYMEDIRAYRDIVQTADLRKPHQWFPVARALTRRIVYHAGPTNSGKTYNALLAMKGADSGVYCGPLRLLAMEVYDNCNVDGTYCNLITGQERREVPGATHTACTVEMVNMHRRVDVAVIDEIQMIGDESRGWAWTRALMGVPANEVHVCGDGSAVDLVRRICEEMGESFEMRSYERFTSLDVEEGGLGKGGYSEVQPGDCIVAFSRKDIYAIKQFIERETKHRACVVYGGLPPETRRMQARLFNDAETRYKVLVASDAVGMGLNLNIRRIIFHSMHKYEGGRRQVPVSVSQVKQIAGRAGRRSSQWGQGLATCRDARDVARLRQALQVPLADLSTPTAGLFPEFEHLEVFAGQHPDEPFQRLLSMFGENALLDSSYFFCKQDSVLGAAQLLEQLPLSLRDMYNFCMAPASATDLRLGAALLHFAGKYARGAPVELAIDVPRRVPANVDELRHMEAAHQVAMLWLWLSYRFEEESFPGRQRAEKLAAAICDLLDRGLERVTRACKRGVDISAEPARPAMEGVLDCFSDEYSQLVTARESERAGSRRRSRRLTARLEAAQLALEVAAAGEDPGVWGALGSSSGPSRGVEPGVGSSRSTDSEAGSGGKGSRRRQKAAKRGGTVVAGAAGDTLGSQSGSDSGSEGEAGDAMACAGLLLPGSSAAGKPPVQLHVPISLPSEAPVALQQQEQEEQQQGVAGREQGFFGGLLQKVFGGSGATSAVGEAVLPAAPAALPQLTEESPRAAAGAGLAEAVNEGQPEGLLVREQTPGTSSVSTKAAGSQRSLGRAGHAGAAGAVRWRRQEYQKRREKSKSSGEGSSGSKQRKDRGAVVPALLGEGQTKAALALHQA